MPQDPQQALRHLSDRMIREGIGNYLLSGQFLRFCSDHDLSEIWGGLLRDSADRPEVYGSDTVRNALFRLLEHIYHGRKVEFPRIFADLLADYAKKPSDLLFVPAVKQDLIKLGYSREEVEESFSITGG